MPADARQVRELFLSAAERPDVERGAYLTAHCGDDAELKAAVERLLAAHEQPADVLMRPAPGIPTAAYEPISEKPGTMIGPYKLMEQIGEGGMGLVFVAEQSEPVRRKVALKVIKPGMDSRLVIARFEAERQALALMDHPNIARVLDAGTVGEEEGKRGGGAEGTGGGRPYFVMELVKGPPITQFCDDNRLTTRQRLELFTHVCHAVQHAHQKGIIHRDIKPTNVLVASHDGTPVVKVIDFGVAKAVGQQLTERTIYTALTQMIGTPLYMSPEQAGMSSLDIDTRTDIYSLGVLLYELLTGTTPFDRERMKQAAFDEVRRIIREEEPPKPSTRVNRSRLPDGTSSPGPARQAGPTSKLLRGELDWVVMKALEKDRTRRYETANGLARDIQRYLADELVEARPPSAGYRLRKFARKNRAALTTATAIAVLLLAGIAGTTFGLFRAEHRRQEAEQARADESRQRTKAEAATEAERLARVGEADRAEGERLAKLDADRRRIEAETNLAFAKKGNEILGSVFSGLDPKQEYATVAELRNALRDNLNKAVTDLEGAAIGDPLEVAAMQYTLGASLLGLGEAKAAIDVFQKALETRRARLGADHPDTLTTTNNLAIGHHQAGQLDKALPLFEETLKLQQARLGPDHPHTLLTMNNLASGYLAAGQLERALLLFEETLKLMRAKLGPDHPDTLASMGNLASVHQHAGQLDEALPLFEETLKLMQARLGTDHPDTLTTLNNLAVAYHEAGQLDKALPLYEETSRLKRAKLGVDHPDTLMTMSNLAAGYQHAGQLERALPLYEETFKLRKFKLGFDHPETLVSMNNLAAAHWTMQQLDKSIPMFEEALRLKERKLGRQHHDTLMTVANLGVNYRDAGRFAEAIPLLEEAYRAATDHPRLRFVGLELVDGYVKSARSTEAARLIGELLADTRKQFSSESPELSAELARFGSVLFLAKAFAEAEPLLRECLAIRAKHEPDAWTTFNTQSLLGGALQGQTKYAEAEPLLMAGYVGMKQRESTIPPQASTRISETLDRLIELYAATDRPGEAEKWQAERAKYPEVSPSP